MGAYILRRLLLMIPTIFGIMALSFLVVQFAPGGPVEQAIANMTGANASLTERVSGAQGGDFVDRPSQNTDSGSAYRGSRGLSPELIAAHRKAVRLRQAARSNASA